MIFVCSFYFRLLEIVFKRLSVLKIGQTVFLYEICRDLSYFFQNCNFIGSQTKKAGAGFAGQEIFHGRRKFTKSRTIAVFY